MKTMINPLIFKIFYFVLKNSRFSLKDRLEYLTYLIFVLIGVSLVGYTVWISLDINYLGLTILAILFLRGPSLYQKFVIPYYEALGDEERARREAEGARYVQELARETVVASVKTEIFFGIMGIIFGGLFLFTILVLFKPMLELSPWLAGLVMGCELLLFAIISILVWRKTWRPVSKIEAKAPERFRKPFLFKFLLVIIILITVCGFIVWRYQKITERRFFESQFGRTTYVNNLPNNKYLLIQQTRFADAEIGLTKDSLISSTTFTLNLQEGSLNFKFSRVKEIKEKEIVLFDSPELIIFVRIRDDEIGREFKTGKYDISSVIKLPVYLDTSASYYSPKIVGVENDGTLLIEREAFDPKVAEMGVDEGKVKETIKLLVGESFPYKTENGQSMRLLNLGLFAKEKITFAEATTSKEATFQPKTTPSTTPIPQGGKEVAVVENFSITEESGWYIARGVVTNKSQQTIKPVYVSLVFYDANDYPFASSESLVNPSEGGALQPEQSAPFVEQVQTTKPYSRYTILAFPK